MQGGGGCERFQNVYRYFFEREPLVLLYGVLKRFRNLQIYTCTHPAAVYILFKISRRPNLPGGICTTYCTHTSHGSSWRLKEKGYREALCMNNSSRSGGHITHREHVMDNITRFFLVGSLARA